MTEAELFEIEKMARTALEACEDPYLPKAAIAICSELQEALEKIKKLEKHLEVGHGAAVCELCEYCKHDVLLDWGCSKCRRESNEKLK